MFGWNDFKRDVKRGGKNRGENGWAGCLVGRREGKRK